MTQECEHGLSAALCAGSMHYPAEDGQDYPVTVSDAAGQYHAQGLPCPFDCAACDQPNEADFYVEPEPDIHEYPSQSWLEEENYEYAMDTEHGIDFPVDDDPPF